MNEHATKCRAVSRGVSRQRHGAGILQFRRLAWAIRASVLGDHLDNESDATIESPTFTEYVSGKPWMSLVRSGVGMMCRSEGIELRPPSSGNGHAVAFEWICSEQGVGEKHVLAIPQAQLEEYPYLIETRDRLQAASLLLRDTLQAGL